MPHKLLDRLFAVRDLPGAVFFGEYAATQTFIGICTYSLVYNGGYMGAEAILSGLISSLPSVRNMLKRVASL